MGVYYAHYHVYAQQASHGTGNNNFSILWMRKQAEGDSVASPRSYS